MNKIILSEQALYHGDVAMPKGFEINQDVLKIDIFVSKVKNSEFEYSKFWDMLNTYIREHIHCEFNINLINKKTWGNIYTPNQTTEPLLNIDPVDLRNSPDYTCLYGIDVNDCIIKIHYEDNRRKGRRWEVELKDNMFIIFPSTCMYYITNNQKDDLNFIQTITYERH
tara:strand:+ start:288 stop:791 length:504 start_codon:yes stop_codon:yes gene_type:complete